MRTNLIHIDTFDKVQQTTETIHVTYFLISICEPHLIYTYILQERIQDNMVAYSAEIAQSVISMLQSMLGTPPDLHLIMSICDFLILVHPATNSYINHTKSSFYFTTWWSKFYNFVYNFN